jgi:hypothetical protein
MAKTNMLRGTGSITGVHLLARATILFIKPALGPTQPPTQLLSWAREGNMNHSPPSSVKVKLVSYIRDI